MRRVRPHRQQPARALRGDPHLAPFLGLPDKENGLDIEGIAAKDGKLFLGLRGPVIRGYAVILQLSVAIQGSRVRLFGVGSGGRRYRKFFLDLGGLVVYDRPNPKRVAKDGSYRADFFR